MPCTIPPLLSSSFSSVTSKDIDLFINSVKYKIYNKIVESPKSDKKLLGLFKFRVTCDIVSNSTNRKILKINEVVQGKNKDDAKEVIIQSLKTRYGDDVIWSRMKINFLGR